MAQTTKTHGRLRSSPQTKRKLKLIKSKTPRMTTKIKERIGEGVRAAIVAGVTTALRNSQKKTSSMGAEKTAGS